MIDIPVVGTTKDHRLGREIRAAYAAGARLLSLRAEPENPHHRLAIAVYLHRGRQSWKVGYLPREVADELKGDPYRAHIVGWYWVGSEDWPGLRVRFEGAEITRAVARARAKGRPWANPPKAQRQRQQVLF